MIRMATERILLNYLWQCLLVNWANISTGWDVITCWIRLCLAEKSIEGWLKHNPTGGRNVQWNRCAWHDLKISNVSPRCQNRYGLLSKKRTSRLRKTRFNVRREKNSVRCRLLTIKKMYIYFVVCDYGHAGPCGCLGKLEKNYNKKVGEF